MSEAELPEDPQKWPRDPYALLGISAQDELVTVRRAYTRLIRRFKPEHFPEQFIRLREAYEQITAHRDSTSRDDENDFDLQSSSSQPQELFNQLSNQRRGPSTSDPRTLASLDEIWTLASRGCFEEALAKFGSHSWQPSELQSVKLAEYWITKLSFPASDDSRAIRILLSHLHLYTRLPKVMEIVQVELTKHPTLVGQLDLAQCLDSLIDVDDILDVVHLRWSAALRVLQFSLIANDWQLLQKLYAYDASVQALLAFAILDYLVWSPDPDHQTLVERIASRSNGDMSDGLDRLHNLRGIAEELVLFEAQCARWHDFARWAPFIWNDIDFDFATSVYSWLVLALDNPGDALRFFDDLRPYRKLSSFFSQRFRIMVEEANEFAEPQLSKSFLDHVFPWSSREINSMERELIEECLSGYNQEVYEQFRIQLARFALQKNIALPKICAFIEEGESVICSFFSHHFLNQIKADHSLATLTQVFRNWLP